MLLFHRMESSCTASGYFDIRRHGATQILHPVLPPEDRAAVLTQAVRRSSYGRWFRINKRSIILSCAVCGSAVHSLAFTSMDFFINVNSAKVFTDSG
jgi:hypothetical protein